MTYNREKKRAYYLKNRARILAYQNAYYNCKTDKKCKICGADLKDMPNAHFKYCTACVSDKAKVSRQTMWYRRNRFRLQVLKKLNKNKEC